MLHCKRVRDVWVLLVLVSPAAAQDQPPRRTPTFRGEQSEARAVVDRAIDFLGGRDVLARYKKPFARLSNGTIFTGGDTKAVKVKLTTSFPDKTRTDQTGEHGWFLLVFDGEKGWFESGSRLPANRAPAPKKSGPREMNETMVRLTRDRVYQQWLATLLPLDDPAFHLAKVDEIVIDGRPAAGIKVSREARPDVQFYFDKENYALVKLARSVNDRRFEEFYRNYGDFDGLKYPRLIVQFNNGKKMVELKTTELTFLDAVEEGTFEQPNSAAGDGK